MKTKLLLSLILALFTSSLWAYDVEVNGIYYNLVEKGNIAFVTNCVNHYSGEVTIPSKIDINGKSYDVTGIGDRAFYLSNKLTKVNIPNSITSIGTDAFRLCTSLSSIVLPNSITTIGESAFHECSSLIDITLPNNLTTISAKTFYYCISLTDIVIPNSVTTIKGMAFAECRSLTNITIPNSVTTLDGGFAHCISLKDITLPNNITTIQMGCFIDCTSLETITIPEGVTQINMNAFTECSNLKKVILPSSLKKIETEAFSNCPKLEEIYCHSEQVPTASSNAFANSFIEYCNLYIPENAINSYETSDPWSQFGKIKSLSDGNAIDYIETSSFRVSSTGQTINIKGAEYVNHIEFYNLSGSYLGAEQVVNGEASFETDEKLVIVKIGEKKIKVKNNN